MRRTSSQASAGKKKIVLACALGILARKRGRLFPLLLLGIRSMSRQLPKKVAVI